MSEQTEDAEAVRRKHNCGSDVDLLHKFIDNAACYTPMGDAIDALGRVAVELRELRGCRQALDDRWAADLKAAKAIFEAEGRKIGFPSNKEVVKHFIDAAEAAEARVNGLAIELDDLQTDATETHLELDRLGVARRDEDGELSLCGRLDELNARTLAAEQSREEWKSQCEQWAEKATRWVEEKERLKDAAATTEAENERLRAAMKPFVEALGYVDERFGFRANTDDWTLQHTIAAHALTFGDLRRAGAALEAASAGAANSDLATVSEEAEVDLTASYVAGFERGKDESRAEVERLRAALAAMLQRDERNTCQHDETHRGGFIWEICDQCGAQWADDEGGKPEWRDPPEWVEARAALAAADKAPYTGPDAALQFWTNANLRTPDRIDAQPDRVTAWWRVGRAAGKDFTFSITVTRQELAADGNCVRDKIALAKEEIARWQNRMWATKAQYEVWGFGAPPERAEPPEG